LAGGKLTLSPKKNATRRYYQVAYLLPDEATVEREFGNLAKIPDDYPKFVISMDPLAGGERQGIQHLPLREFLLSNA
jgi:predicted AAA+ superfamily ATPase